MASECFFSACKYHSKDEPMCYEVKCKATPSELATFERRRDEYLFNVNWVDIGNLK